MSTKFRNLKNDLKDLENDTVSQFNNEKTSSNFNSGKLSNYILLFAFIATLTFYVGSRFNSSNFNFATPIEEFAQSLSEPDEDLIIGMGTWMQEMGYGELSREELIDLRREGVTATYTSEMRDLGYTDVTLDQLVELQRADVSVLYSRMMKELGYEFTVQDLIDTRRNGVSANFTSRMMDLGYTFEQLTKENLIRMRSVGVSEGLAQRLQERNDGILPTIDELIRYRISNQ